ncbi:MAG: beta strand repeat-containing protein, partial [Aggregatilineales bacterium]
MFINRSHRRSIYLIVTLFTTSAIALIGFGQSGTTHPAQAAAWVVFSTADSGGTCPGATCTLRQAISQVSSGDTITFDSSLSGQTITLTSAPLAISQSVTITGLGASNTLISGGSTLQVMTIAAGSTVTLNSLTIENGKITGSASGAGINNSGTLTVNNSTFSNNVVSSSHNAGAIQNGGTLTITNSTFSNNSSIGGGAIAGGTIAISNSTFTNNSSHANGGVIYGPAQLSISSSTFTSNSAASSGGVIYGGGSTTISNSTLSGNKAKSGGGIYLPSGTLNLLSDIIASNTATVADPNLDIVSGTFSSLGHNFIGDGTGASGFAGTDQVGSSASPLNPQLGALAANSGSTQTLALPVDSLAYQTGDCSGNNTVTPHAPSVTTDQRGVSRKVVGVGCDVGAFEETFTFTPTGPSLLGGTVGTTYLTQTIVASGGTSPYTYTVSNGTLPPGLTLSTGGSLSGTPTATGTYTFTVVATDNTGVVGSVYYTVTISGLSSAVVFSTADSGGTCPGATCTLRTAIASVNSGGTITFDSSLSGQTITLTSAPLAISKNLTITGLGASNTLISGGSTLQVATIAGGSTVTLNSLTIENGKSAASGAGINNSGTLTVNNCAFSGNSTTGAGSAGGGISSSGTLTITASTFAGNSAPSGYGGGLENDGTGTITNSTFVNNTSTNGGGIDITGGSTNTLTIQNSTFSGNSGGSFGGGGVEYYQGGTLTIQNSAFSGNSATSFGGALDETLGTTLIVQNSTFSGNSTASGKGGGIEISQATLYLGSTIVAGNTTGGALDVHKTGGTITTLGYNLIGDGTGDGFTAAVTDQVGTTANPINPNLGGLGSYGGSTQTLELLSGSPAISAGNCALASPAASVTTDQRGVARKVVGAGCDVGAFESFSFSPAALPNAIESNTYSQSITASGGTASYTFSSASGLPTGLTLTSGGTLQGTPTQSGAFPFTFTVTDSSGNLDQGGYMLTVLAPTATPTSTPTNTPTATPTNTPTPSPRIDSIGVFRSGTFYLRLHNSTGFADINVVFKPGTKPYPVVGDRTGVSYDMVGVFDQSNGLFTLCTANDTTTCANTANQISFVLG